MPDTPEIDTFDPARHLTADGKPASNNPVHLELACSCGAVRKQYDPPDYLARTLETWNLQHAGPGHSPVSIADAVTERENRREAAYRAAGRAEDFQRSEPQDMPTTVAAWPDLAAAGTGQNPQEG